MSINFTLSIGYTRRRPGTTDRIEQRIDAFGLLLVGAAIAIAIIWIVLPRVLDWLSHLP